MRKRSTAVAGAMIGMMTLVGCGVDAPVGPVEITAPTPDAVETTEPAPDPGTPTVPESCLVLDVDPGEELAGEVLSACVADALRAYGSGRMQTLLDGVDGTPDGEVEFTYEPDYAMHGEVTVAGGRKAVVRLDGEMWIDSGGGWVKADRESSNPSEALVGMTTELHRLLSDPEVAAELVASAPVWTVAAELETRSSPDGSEVEALRIDAVRPFSWGDFPIEGYSLWYSPDWMPVGTQSTIFGLGETIISGQLFYDLGVDITIDPVG